jgi:alpha-ketoglutarate-dependent taurine dioxygenase
MRCFLERPLDENELSVAPTTYVPRVIEPISTDVDLLSVLNEHCSDFCRLIELHGSLLFRGWNVCSKSKLASAMAVLQQRSDLVSIDDYFPAEHGRDRKTTSRGTTVWPTNTLKRTGGYLVPEVVPHTENYYAVPTPRIVAFACEQAPWLGGETALFDSLAVLRSLPAKLRKKLAKPCTARRLLSLDRLRRRHNIGSEAEVSSLASSLERMHGARLEYLRAEDALPAAVAFAVERTAARPCSLSPLGGDSAVSHAPSVRCQFNFGDIGHRQGARHALLQALLERGLWSGREWMLHRWLWEAAIRWPATFGVLLEFADDLPGWLTSPLCMMRRRADARAAVARSPPPIRKKALLRPRVSTDARGAARLDGLGTLGELLTEREGERLAQAIGENAVAFPWKVGDLLLLDNERIMHDGLPGVGPRNLSVALLACG